MRIGGCQRRRRWGAMGPNVLDFIQEFSKPFYLYQNFTVGTCKLSCRFVVVVFSSFSHHRIPKTLTTSQLIGYCTLASAYAHFITGAPVKGALKAIGKLCIPSSLPSHFEAKARQSARDGIYQLGSPDSSISRMP
mmetsp:Transcript_3722/g.7898  ORF Transcript_3722/g.7898 Transcript_3722/m.7898 type:complete len:135 (+) Transcript_3722:1483-1887(+)